MAEQYPIVSVSAPEHWSGNYGPMVSYQLLLAGEAEPVGLNQRPETPAPQIGQNLFGDIWVDGAGRRKFKKAQQQQGAQTALNGSSGPAEDKPDWDGKDRRILEENSHNVAGQLVAAAIGAGQLNLDHAVERVKDIADILSSRVLRKGREGLGEPQPDFKDSPAPQAGVPAQEFQPSPGQSVTEAASQPLATPFDPS